MEHLRLHSIGWYLLVLLVSGCANIDTVGSVSTPVAPGPPPSNLSPGCLRTTFEEDEGSGEFRQFAKAFIDAVRGDLRPDLQAEAEAARTNSGGTLATSLLDQFLDCYIGPVEKAEDTHEMQLLRGHMIVTGLARYGAFNIRFEQEDEQQQRDDAVALLARIERAEGMLRRASAIDGIGSSTDTDQRRESLLPRFSRMERIAAVLDVAIDAERPTIRRARRLVRNVTLAAAGSGAGLSDVLQDAFRGIRKITMLELYGKAYRLDLKHYLATKEKVTKADWEGWDTLLGEGCNQLAEIGSVQHHCLPKE